MKLYRHGDLKQGMIVSMIPKSGLPFSNAGQGILVHYQYEVNGEKLMGESKTSDFSIMSNNQKGDLIPIFVASNNPHKSCVVPKLEALRNNWGIKFD
ncbi:MAG: hypothetical protein JJ978_18610 [Roseivirga sp.]|uniref:hypothetical protein n=1 Tax=Roseivirga sp. TaxID=1964215 RepID=UPI001B02652F|nr:hypothetical protein [Roseivirga sp.]MBO6497586.1 hypothetical protein [Roseivirga sp.]